MLIVKCSLKQLHINAFTTLLYMHGISHPIGMNRSRGNMEKGQTITSSKSCFHFNFFCADTICGIIGTEKLRLEFKSHLLWASKMSTSSLSAQNCFGQFKNMYFCHQTKTQNAFAILWFFNPVAKENQVSYFDKLLMMMCLYRYHMAIRNGV